MSKNYLISIITPSYNQGDFIGATISSVVGQGYDPLELIIIDGGSRDNSVSIIKNHAEHISYWVSEPDRGQSHAINKGFQRAGGEIVAWLNSDDLYCENTLKFVGDTFKANPGLDIIYGDVINLYADGTEELYKVPPFDPLDFISRVSIHQPAVFWRRELLHQAGHLDENLHYCMDYDLWARFFFSYQSMKVDRPLAKFRIHEQSKTSSNPPEMYAEYRKVVSRFFNSTDQLIVQKLTDLGIYSNGEKIAYSIPRNMDKNLLDRMMQRYVYQCAIQEYSFGNRKKANQLFKECWQEKKEISTLLFLLKNNLGIRQLKNKFA